MRSKIHVSVLFVFLLLAMIYFSPERSPAMILAVAIHEMGHIVAAKICGIEVGKFKLGILGAAIVPRRPLYSYKEEFILCIGGPLANFLSALLICRFHSAAVFTESLLLYSISLGALNLLPIKSFDGGRIFSAILSCLLSPKTAERVLNLTSFLLIFTLWSISVYLLLKISSSVSLFVFSVALFTKIFLPDTE